MPVTRVGALPLVAAPAHEWNTLLTVLKQGQAINVKVQYKTIQCVVPENIHTYPTEGHGNSVGWGGV